ncbi:MULTISPECIES: peptidylprolyl isomerase [unclassified Janthinobacterium]|uniref:peptidylprolyl isomerase n=1 Tax=unclassified Janthinobacterium TaxID=2610881 RepID=UPI00028859EC|nr:peptidylprolyl isomerase [Janthinobacterium sp. CG_23.4]MCL6483317.1 peptidyl-prolyl cis-trans isomerase [Janthinobacterium lividum]MDH6157394.1 peptidyl-prolyl cis-trans isomerase A (cyclophilin A)/peptidyl-prolyl cis-trans isomerase B (cyclophilin B) [Janthinobacterium sp. CG_23.4]
MQEIKSKRLSFLARFCTVFAGLTLGSAVVAAAPASPAAAPASAPHVSLKTSLGEIVLELNQEKAPHSVANFLQYVKSGYYKGTVFHRVIDGFMIQGGGFEKNMKQKAAKAPIKNEAQNGLQNVTYSIAMARTGDPHSATSQFFINVNDNGALDYPGRDGFGYTVFGKVVSGMDVVDKIKAVPVADKGPHQNVPVTPVVIESATLLKSAPAKL